MGLQYFGVVLLCVSGFLGYTYGQSDCGPQHKGWLLFQDHCYLVEGRIGSAYTWHNANKYCRDRGALLASIHSADENEFIAKQTTWTRLHPTIWLGLNSLEKSSISWLDGTPIDYTRVNVSMVDKTRRCAALDSPDPTRRWLFMHCDTEAAFVCKRRRDDPSVTISPPVTTASPGNCPEDWNRIGNKCFKIFSSRNGHSVNHSEARSACLALGSGHDMASIHTQEENLRLTTLTAKEETNLWIGLSRITFTTFGWTDNSQLDFTNWAPGEPSSVAEGCTEFITNKLRSGMWNDNSCRQRMGYICQRDPDGTAETPAPPADDCPNKDYVRFGESCFGFFDGKYETTWKDAEQLCKEHGGNLASIHTGHEMAFFKTSILPQTTGALWIGLTTTKTRVYQWSDGWPVTYLEVNRSSSPMAEACGFINPNGTWNIGSCAGKMGFLCRMNEESRPDYPQIDNRPCPSHISPLLDVGLTHCYAVRDYASFGGANLQCMKNDTFLASFHHQHELDLLAPYLINRPKGFWIGQLKKFHGRFEWLDGTRMDFNFWDENEPSMKEKQDCVVLSPLNLKAKAVDCNDSYSYICKVSKD